MGRRLTSILLVTLLGFSSAVYSAGAKSHPKKPQTTTELSDNSSKVFNNFMNDPFLNGVFQQAQKDRLKTIADRTFEDLFDTDPLLQELRPLLLASVQDSVRKTVAENEGASMTLITPDNFPRLHRLAAFVLKRQGFSEEQISKAHLFRAMGPINAYTFSASKDDVVFVIYDSLDDKASDAEVIGVIGHETGHILAQHVLMDTMNMIMMSQIIRHFGISDEKEGSLFDYSKILWGKITGKDNENRQMVENYINGFLDQIVRNKTWSRAVADPSKGRDVWRDSLKNDIFVLSRKLEDRVKAMPPEDQKAFLGRYLQVVITNCVQQGQNKLAMYFQSLLQNLDTKQVFKVNLDELAEKLALADSAILTQEQEATADLFGNLVQRALKASGMDMKFVGGGDTKTQASDAEDAKRGPKAKQLKEWLAGYQKQAQEALSMVTRDEWIDITKGNIKTNHPPGILRIIYQNFYERSISLIALSNPFLMNVVLYDQVSDIVSTDQDRLKYFDELLEKLKGKLPKNEFEEEAAKIEVTKKVINDELTQAQTKASQVSEAIVKLLSSSKLAKVNPRLTDLLDFRLARKQFLLKMVEGLSADPGAAKNKAIQETIEGFKARLAQDDKLLAAVEEKLTSDIKKGTNPQIEEWLKVTQTANHSVKDDEIKGARELIAKKTKSERRITPDPSPETEIKSSSIKVKASFAEKKRDNSVILDLGVTPNRCTTTLEQIKSNIP